MQSPEARLVAAVLPSRSLLFYTLTATLPILVLSVVLLATRLRGRGLLTIAVLGALTGFIGLGRLLYEMTFDIAGFPDYKLPIWSVLYLIIYVVSSFAFLFFALDQSAPGVYFRGFKGPKTAFLESLYLSLSNYIGVPPDSVIGLPAQTSRFLSVGQGALSLFVNLVIITKFVNAF